MNLTAGVIGCGNISQFHFHGLESAGVRIKWICDLDEQKAKPWIEKYKAKFTRDYRDIINDGEVDVINIAAISSIHKAICLSAIADGKAVICEKTLAENASDALEIVTEAEKQQSIFYTSYMKRFIPAVQKAKELMPSLGRIISTHIRAYQNWGDKWNDTGERPVEASGVMKSYGGGILHCGGSHIFDLVLFFLGRPHRLYATMYKPEWLDYDIQAAAFLETANGIVHYEALAHPLKKIGFLRDGWDEKVEINGVNGRLEIYSSNWHEVDCKSSILLHYDNHDGSLHEYRFDPESPFNRAMKFFCGNISAKIQGAQSRFTGYEVDELISNTQLSSAEKKAVGIDWKI